MKKQFEGKKIMKGREHYAKFILLESIDNE